MLQQGEFFGQFLSEYKKRGVLSLVGGLLLVAALVFYLSIPPGTWLQWRINLAKSGATINLKPGVIQRNIAIAKSIVLAGDRPNTGDVHTRSAETTLGGIAISGDSDVQVTLRDIRVIGTIVIADDVQVTLRDIQAYGRIAITDEAQVTLRDIRVSVGGITITDEAQVTLRDIQVRGGGIVISDLASARMERVQVSGSTRGLLVHQTADVQLIDCMFSDNVEEGTLVTGNGILQGERCQWVGNQRVGLRVAGSGAVELTACTIRDSLHYGLVLEKKASAVVAATMIIGTGEAEPMSGGTIPTEYTSRYQWGSGVLLTDDSHLSLTNCTVTGNAPHGIVAFDNASLSLTNCRATGSDEIGIVTFDNASVFRKVEE